MAANIPLPDSPLLSPSSPLPSPTQLADSEHHFIQPLPVRSNLTNIDLAPSLPERTLRLIVEVLQPILSGKHTLLSLYQALDQLSKDPDYSQSDHTHKLFKSLSERFDQLDQLKICNPSIPQKLEHPPSGLLDQVGPGNSQDDHATDSIKTELEALQTKLKLEEEKRAKSISLLRAVRQKLVQTEKDKTGLENELNQIKFNTSTKIEELQSSKRSLEDELSKLKIFNDQQLSNLRHSSEREICSIRSQYERDAASKKSQFELDTITTKATYERELCNRNQHINQLENRLRELSTDRDKLFDQLQNKQAALEIAQAQNDEVTGNIGELEHQLNESHNRIHRLVEELNQVNRLSSAQDKSEGGSEKMIQEIEQRHLEKTKVLQSRISQLEKERFDVEKELTDSLQERLQQIEILRTESRLKSEEYAHSLESMAQGNEEIAKTDAEIKFLKNQLESTERVCDSQSMMVANLKQQLDELQNQFHDQASQLNHLKSQLNESVRREDELKSENQRIRENEIQKVDEVKRLFLRAGGAMMGNQNQRKEGVGYFANFSRQSMLTPSESSTTTSTKIKSSDHSRRGLEHTDDDDDNELRDHQQEIHDCHCDPAQDKQSDSSLTQSTSHLPPHHDSVSLPPSEKFRHDSVGQDNKCNNNLNSSVENEAELNFEYLRNTLLQFLEHKEMRPHLVRVLGVILHFTPHDIRRLAANV